MSRVHFQFRRLQDGDIPKNTKLTAIPEHKYVDKSVDKYVYMCIYACVYMYGGILHVGMYMYVYG